VTKAHSPELLFTERNTSGVRAAWTLDFLLGTWSVERWIDDQLGGDVGTFQGTATFVADVDEHVGVRCDETGVVRFADYSGRATRRLYLCEGADSLISVSFADGQHFIDLNLRAGSSRDHHQCVNDGYDITTTVVGDDRIEEEWRVHGPAKNYVALSVMTRVR
jgi:Family of unknown function (DUF6314)